MAKDDYFVIVYQVSSYLYIQLKAGEPVDGKMLQHDSNYLNINERYWNYVMQNLQESGYIKGISIIKTFGGDVVIGNLDNCQITPDGIEYLCDNSTLSRAKDFLKDVKAIVPFI